MPQLMQTSEPITPRRPPRVTLFFRRAAPEILGAVVLVAFGIVLLVSMRFKSLTWDEPTHYSFGARMLENGRQTQVTLSSMAISQLNVLPNFYLRGDRVHRPRSIEAIFAARVPTVLAAVLLGGVLFAFSRRLFGSWAGFGSLVVFCLSPTLLAHSRWVTNDVYCSLFMLSTLYSFWRYLESQKISWLVLCGALFGAAQVAKFTSLLLFPVLGILLFVFWLAKRRKQKKHPPENGSSRLRVWQSSLRLAVFVVTAWVVWNGAYYFQKSFVSWRSTRFQSGFMKTVQSVLGPLPTLLPSPYLGALDVTFHINDVHSGRGYIYLLGETSKKGFPHYFLIALLYKVPLAFWVIFLVALIYAFRGRPSRSPTGRSASATGPPPTTFKELVVVIPAVFLGFYFLFFCTAQIGVRYLMPLLVLFQILTGRLWVFEGGMREKRNVLRAVGLGGAVLWMAASSLSYYPHFLSYFNGLVGDKKNAYRVLADSNLDWKQNRRYLDRYLKSQGLSRANLNPTWPRAGTWIVSANRLVGVNHPSEYRWLRRFTPHGHVFFSHLRFRLQEKDLRKVLGFKGGKLLQASSVRRNDLVRGIWRVGYPGHSPKGEACGTKALRGLSVGRVCRRSDHFFARFFRVSPDP